MNGNVQVRLISMATWGKEQVGQVFGMNLILRGPLLQQAGYAFPSQKQTLDERQTLELQIVYRRPWNSVVRALTVLIPGENLPIIAHILVLTVINLSWFAGDCPD